jgi:hypothetical protein
MFDSIVGRREVRTLYFEDGMKPWSVGRRQREARIGPANVTNQ